MGRSKSSNIGFFYHILSEASIWNKEKKIFYPENSVMDIKYIFSSLFRSLIASNI